MANATETTKQAAVWNPPRIRKYKVYGVESGTKPSPTLYEGLTNPAVPPGSPALQGSQSHGYRMPLSGEPVPWPYPWQ